MSVSTLVVLTVALFACYTAGTVLERNSEQARPPASHSTYDTAASTLGRRLFVSELKGNVVKRQPLGNDHRVEILVRRKRGKQASGFSLHAAETDKGPAGPSPSTRVIPSIASTSSVRGQPAIWETSTVSPLSQTTAKAVASKTEHFSSNRAVTEATATNIHQDRRHGTTALNSQDSSTMEKNTDTGDGNRDEARKGTASDAIENKNSKTRSEMDPKRHLKSFDHPGVIVGIIFGAIAATAVPLVLCFYCGCVSCIGGNGIQPLDMETDSDGELLKRRSSRSSTRSIRQSLDCSTALGLNKDFMMQYGKDMMSSESSFGSSSEYSSA